MHIQHFSGEVRVQPYAFATTAELISERLATLDLPFAADDWRILHDTRANALVVGSPMTINAAVASLLPLLRQPLMTWEPSVLREPPLPSTGTLVIQRVDSLNAVQQRCLLNHLSSPTQDLRVISLASTPVYPLVKRGEFSAPLYYRLNILCL